MAKTMKQMNIKLHYQPTGNTCGPTCLFMALQYTMNKRGVEYKHHVKDSDEILNIAKLCGTDWTVGTPPDRMEKGMKALGMVYMEYEYPLRPYSLIRHILDEDNVPIIRTIVREIPHWIVVSGYTKQNKEYLYTVLDPSDGIVTHNQESLDEIWKVRNYQFFEVSTSISDNRTSITDELFY